MPGRKDGRTEWRRALRSTLLVAAAIGLAVFAAVEALRRTGALAPVEVGLYDAALRLRPPLEGEPPVVLVTIREEEIASLGHPLPDDVLAEALERLGAAQPRAIGVDLYRDGPVGEGAERLRGALLGDPRIVMIDKLADASGPGVATLPFLDRGRVGFSDLPVDPDGGARRGLLYLWDEEGQPALAFALQLALRHLEPEGLDLGPDPEDPARVRLGATTIPAFEGDDGGYVGIDAGGYQFLLDYARGREPFRAFPLADVLAGEVPAAALRGRTLILGTTSPSVKDHFRTPVDSSRGPTYGIEVHAHVFDQLVRTARGGSRPFHSLSEAGEALVALVAALAGALLALRLRSPLAVAAAGLAAVALLAGAGFGALLYGLWVPVVPAALAGLTSAGLTLGWQARRERVERALVMQLFGRFVSPRVARDIWEQRDAFLENGHPRPQRVTLTVLMADLAGFTAAGEKLDPEGLLDWLDEFFEAMAHTVETHGGIVDDYYGDGMKADFGAPVVRHDEAGISEDAVNAVRCGLEMGAALEHLNERWRAAGLPTARLRVGIVTGPAVVGSLGGRRKLKYTSVGDTPNTAARIEAFDRAGFAAEADATLRVLIGEETKRLVADTFVIESLGSYALKGKGHATAIYKVLGARESAPAGRQGGSR